MQKAVQQCPNVLKNKTMLTELAAVRKSQGYQHKAPPEKISHRKRIKSSKTRHQQHSLLPKVISFQEQD
jgi:hypothetical protein